MCIHSEWSTMGSRWWGDVPAIFSGSGWALVAGTTGLEWLCGYSRQVFCGRRSDGGGGGWGGAGGGCPAAVAFPGSPGFWWPLW